MLGVVLWFHDYKYNNKTFRMDSISQDFSSLLLALGELRQRVEALEKEVASLRGDAVPSEEPFSAEPIDLTLDPLPYIAPDIPEAAEPEPVPVETPAVEVPAEVAPVVETPHEEFPVEETPHEEPPVEIIEDIPSAEEVTAAPEDVKVIVEKTQAPVEDSPGEVGANPFENLFGREQEAPAARRGRRRRILNDLESDSAGQSVMDTMADKAAWRHDIPGPEVKSLRSAIGLGDQVLFIRRLFRDDSALYQDSIDKLNNMSTMDEAIDYLSNTFPEWNVASDDVYRFMMAVRRKIRK